MIRYNIYKRDNTVEADLSSNRPTLSQHYDDVLYDTFTS